ncbi:aminopeptidase [bacterium]|nr:aminopeptidase [bacterium]
MKAEWIDRWARLLVRYSIRVERGSVIKVRGGVDAEPLIRAVFAELLRAGAHPRVTVSLPGMTKLFYDCASPAQLSYLSPLDLHEAAHLDGIISIRSERNTRELSSVDPAKQVATSRAAKPLSDIILKNDNWVGTLYPTDGYAQDADMSLGEFETFVARAMFLDKADPVAAWKRQGAGQRSLAARLQRAKTVRISSPDTDLTLSVAGRTAVSSDGHHNMPCGEVFTAPVEDSAEGHITYTYPVTAYGREISGIRLEFSRGVVVKASAGKNEPFLRKMLATDEGARRIGELGIGANYGISRFTGNILFDEKIGGTVHLAVGNAYAKCGGKNKSALHWDMIKDVRKGGTVYFDGAVVQKDGRLVI